MPIRVVVDEHRVRRLKEYVLTRLRDEIGASPRGGQAQLAKRLGVSGAHLSNMVSPSPSRAPGEDFRRKVAAHWGMTYAELEAMALGEEPPSGPASSAQPRGAAVLRSEASPPNLALAMATYAWMPEVPADHRSLVRSQARVHHRLLGTDYPRDEWQRILTGLEREALALLARLAPPEEDTPTSRRVGGRRAGR